MIWVYTGNINIWVYLRLIIELLPITVSTWVCVGVVVCVCVCVCVYVCVYPDLTFPIHNTVEREIQRQTET